ncbi:MAG: hypothetical protein HUU15_09260 [Candidatus Brocadiae bacterium]|nr:hypothetical protein [Candidatus Brocadiia bacterium]
MNRLNVLLTGALAGAIVATLGFVLMRGSQPAWAETGDGSGGLVLATPSSSAADLGSLVYVLKTSPPEDATLTVYKVDQGKRLLLIASRRIVWDLKAFDFTSEGKGLSVDEAKRAIEKFEKEQKEREGKK